MSDNPIKPDPDKKPKRPRDANQLAKYVVDLATHEIEESDSHQSSKPNRSAGAKARTNKLSPERRREIARQAALVRWGKPAHPPDDPQTQS